MNNENKNPEKVDSSKNLNPDGIEQKKEIKDKKMTDQKKARANTIMAGVAGVAVGAGGVYVSQVISGDELVDAEVLSASAAGALHNSSSADSADVEDHSSLADFAQNHPEGDSLAGMDSVKIGDQNGYVNAVLVDSNDDGVFDSAVEIHSIGNEHENTPPAAEPVASSEIVSDTSAEDAINAELISVQADLDGNGSADALLVDSNNDGVYDSVIELVPVSEVINDGAAVNPVPADESDILSVSHSVTDDMSFSEAFASAREEVGAGGIFYWHGKPYGTYYENEWNSMSDEDKDEYWSAVGHTTSAHDDGSYSEFHSSDEIVSDYDHHMMDTNHEDSNDSDPFGSDFDNHANMDDWA